MENNNASKKVENPEIILDRTLAIFKPSLLKKEFLLNDVIMKQGITITQVT